MITWAMAFKTGMSVPIRSCTCLLAQCVNSIFRGSITTRLAPLRTAFFMRSDMTGCASVVLDPITRSMSAPAISSIELLIAPLPTMTARPATVGECQVREQLSILLVPSATRANF